VGQVTREEIDIIERGGNYGWRVFEGTLCTNRGPAECVAANYKMPVAEYDHTGGRCSVTGGNVYRGALSTLPAGAYVYGDFCTGEIFLLQGTAQTLLADTPYFITSFGEDEAGEIYVAGYSSGTVHRIGTTCSYSVSPAPPQDFPASGGQGSFQINTSAGCPWTATSLSPWITITQGAGTGSGTVNFTVAANTGAARAGRILHTENSLYSITQQAAPATLQFSAATFQAGEGEGRALVTVTRAGDPSAAVSVEVSTADDLSPVRCDAVTGVAYPRCDYATTVERVTFTAGDSQPKTVSVPLIDDAHVEGGETLQLKLAAPSGAALGAQQSATLAVTDNDSPGQPNPIRQTTFFVRMHYLDFLSREPEAGEPWSATLDNCPAGDTRCDRVQVSANFFLSEEFRIKGFFVFRFYRAALGRLPTYSEIIPDMRGVTGTTPAEVYAKKAAFTDAFVGRQEFRNRFDALTNQQFVDALLTPYSLQQITTPDPASPDTGAKVTLTRAELVNRLNAATLTRARVVRAVADSDEVAAAEANRAFVAMQYFGYLRRDPEPEGFNNWLNTINADPANYRAMVNGFMNSNEYRLRFGDPER
jgi:hypothetical protein